jgi:alpha-L-fucosidase
MLPVISDYLSINQLVESLVSTVACGGNLLLNVGCVCEFDRGVM